MRRMNKGRRAAASVSLALRLRGDAPLASAWRGVDGARAVAAVAAGRWAGRDFAARRAAGVKLTGRWRLCSAKRARGVWRGCGGFVSARRLRCCG